LLEFSDGFHFFGEKLSINTTKIKRKDSKDFVYKVYVTLTSRATKWTQLFSIRVTHYSAKFLNVQNHDVVSRPITSVSEYQMPLGLHMQVQTGNTCVKIRVKIPSGCSENGEQL